MSFLSNIPYRVSSPKKYGKNIGTKIQQSRYNSDYSTNNEYYSYSQKNIENDKNSRYERNKSLANDINDRNKNFRINNLTHQNQPKNQTGN